MWWCYQKGIWTLGSLGKQTHKPNKLNCPGSKQRQCLHRPRGSGKKEGGGHRHTDIFTHWLRQPSQTPIHSQNPNHKHNNPLISIIKA